MTTPAMQKLYEAEHSASVEGKGYAVYNPKNKPIAELPVIYGFNNGGQPGWLQAQLIAEDGTGLGSHICSAECYMEHDLGILEDSRSDRHEDFKKHYPNGYRMDFVSHDNPKLLEAYKKNQSLGEEANKAQKQDASVSITFS